MLSGKTAVVDAVVVVDVGAEDEVQEELRRRRDLQDLLGHPGVQSIQICLQETGQGATCTENLVQEHISVQNLLHARGKTSTQ